MTARAPKWDRRFAHPIHMADGTTFVTLRDVADWIIAHQPPNAGAAIERLMDAAERGGTDRYHSLASRLGASLQGSRTDSQANRQDDKLASIIGDDFACLQASVAERPVALPPASATRGARSMTDRMSAAMLRRWSMQCASRADDPLTSGDERERLLKMRHSLLDLAKQQDWLDGAESGVPNARNEKGATVDDMEAAG